MRANYVSSFLFLIESRKYNISDSRRLQSDARESAPLPPEFA